MVLFPIAYFLATTWSSADSAVPVSSSLANQAQAATIKASSISPKTQELIAQVQSLSADAQTTLKSQLADIVKQVVHAGKNGKGDLIKDAITQQYLQAASALVQQYDPSSSVDKAILDDFNYYAIVNIERVIVNKGVALVEARIVYSPSKLADIVQDEVASAKDTSESQKQASNAPQQFGGTLWNNFGGSASASKCEKDGIGRVTYYLALQNGLWKLHYCYFSVDPLTDSEVATVNAKMKALVQ